MFVAGAAVWRFGDVPSISRSRRANGRMFVRFIFRPPPCHLSSAILGTGMLHSQCTRLIQINAHACIFCFLAAEARRVTPPGVKRIAMETFCMFLTLSSLVAPQMVFISQPQPWTSQSECVRALPKMEGAVARLIRYDASALKLFGTTIGGLPNPTYFVSSSECKPAGEFGGLGPT
jgi:hypothetical protein